MSATTRKQVLTLIGKGQATIGKTFKLYAIPDECKKCKLYNICVAKIKPGRIYKVVEIRHISLPQPDKCLLTGEEMVPIVAEEQPIIVPIPTKSFLEGIIMTYTKPNTNCNELKNYLNQPISEGSKIKILREISKVKCGNESYTLAEVIPLD